MADAIISDIQDQKDDFKGYFFENCSTTYSSQSAGQITVDYSNSDGISLQELLTKNIMVDVKKVVALKQLNLRIVNQCILILFQ